MAARETKPLPVTISCWLSCFYSKCLSVRLTPPPPPIPTPTTVVQGVTRIITERAVAKETERQRSINSSSRCCHTVLMERNSTAERDDLLTSRDSELGFLPPGTLSLSPSRGTVCRSQRPGHYKTQLCSHWHVTGLTFPGKDSTLIKNYAE